MIRRIEPFQVLEILRIYFHNNLIHIIPIHITIHIIAISDPRDSLLQIKHTKV